MPLNIDKPLNNDELQTLSGLVEKNTDFSLPQLHGFLTSISSSPYLIQPTEWFEALLQGSFENDNDVEPTVSLTMRLYNQVLTDLDEERMLPLLSNKPLTTWDNDVDLDSVRLWCKGYLLGTFFYEDMWEEGSKNAEDDFPQAALNILLVLAIEKDQMKEFTQMESDEEALKEMLSMRKKVVKLLPDLVHDLFIHWREVEALMELEEEDENLENTPSINRNDPCFCGSGKKYKKCCLQ